VFFGRYLIDNYHPVSKILSLVNSVMKYYFAYLFHVFNTKNEPPVCLIGSNYGEKRSDNALALFDYIRDQNKHEIYFVENRPKEEDAIRRGSLKSFIYFFRSEGVFFSHSLSDILPQMHTLPFLFRCLKKPRKVFIQHGVTAMTGLKSVDRYIRKIMATVDFVIATSRIEKALLIKLGATDKSVRITGFPVHDTAVFGKREKKCLVFFTWRKSGNINIEKKAVVNDPEIIKHLHEHQYELIVHYHDMNSHENYRIGVDGQKVVDNGSLREAINEAQILITDNSSVAWDFFYRERDVIFYNPSPDTRVDLRQAGFHVAYSIHELSVLLVSALAEKLPLTDVQDFFSFKDRKNCERVYNLIQ